MPMRGHSGVQGGAEMGAYATALPGGLPITPENAAALEAQYGFPIRSERGLSAAEMVEAGGRGELDVLWYSSGGNFLDVLPDPRRSREALERVPLRVHQDIVLSQPDARRPGEDGAAAPGADALRAAPAAAPRRPRNAASLFSPRHPRAAGWARPVASGRSSSTSPGAWIPQRGHLVDFRDAHARSARRSPA